MLLLLMVLRLTATVVHVPTAGFRGTRNLAPPVHEYRDRRDFVGHAAREPVLVFRQQVDQAQLHAVIGLRRHVEEPELQAGQPAGIVQKPELETAEVIGCIVDAAGLPAEEVRGRVIDQPELCAGVIFAVVEAAEAQAAALSVAAVDDANGCKLQYCACSFIGTKR